jgi:DNA-binding transcriptional regulator YiaG
VPVHKRTFAGSGAKRHTVADRIKSRLEEFTNDLESGQVIQEKYTCRKVEFRLDPQPYDPAAVKRTRELLCASQRIFAAFLGVSAKTVQAWEQGVSAPPKMACRLMDQISRDPEYWRNALRELLVAK